MLKERADLYIKTLAETGSITQAAKALSITPSALSKYIMMLEKELDITIFSRVGYHFVLTDEGTRALGWFSRINQLSEQMDRELLDLKNGKNGKIRFGIQTSTSDVIMNRVLPEFMADWPDIQISLTEGPHHSLMSSLQNYELDFVISTHIPPVENYDYFPLITLHQILYAYAGHPLEKKAVHTPGRPYPVVDLDWCRREKFVLMHRGQRPRTDMEDILSPIIDDISVSLEVSTMHSLLEAVNNGLGLMAAADGIDFMYLNQWKNLIKFSLNTRGEPITYYIFWHKGIYRSEAALAMIEIIKNEFNRINRQIESHYVGKN